MAEWSCALGLTGLQSTKLSYSIASESVTPSAHDWPTPSSPTEMEEPFQLPWTGAAETLFSWTEHRIQQLSPKCAACIDCLAAQSSHDLAAALIPLHIYPVSGWKMQKLVSWSEPWCSAGGKGYQTAGILAGLTRLCTLRLSVKTQLCLASTYQTNRGGNSQ